MRGNVELIYEDLDENTQLTDCYYEKKDWRLCKDEVSFCLEQVLKCADWVHLLQMERFRQCWKAQGNEKRTDTKDN